VSRTYLSDFRPVNDEKAFWVFAKDSVSVSHVTLLSVVKNSTVLLVNKLNASAIVSGDT
jgi:hypothetical protein